MDQPSSSRDTDLDSDRVVDSALQKLTAMGIASTTESVRKCLESNNECILKEYLERASEKVLLEDYMAERVTAIAVDIMASGGLLIGNTFTPLPQEDGVSTAQYYEQEFQRLMENIRYACLTGAYTDGESEAVRQVDLAKAIWDINKPKLQEGEDKLPQFENWMENTNDQISIIMGLSDWEDRWQRVEELKETREKLNREIKDLEQAKKLQKEEENEYLVMDLPKTGCKSNAQGKRKRTKPNSASSQPPASASRSDKQRRLTHPQLATHNPAVWYKGPNRLERRKTETSTMDHEKQANTLLNVFRDLRSVKLEQKLTELFGSSDMDEEDEHKVFETDQAKTSTLDQNPSNRVPDEEPNPDRLVPLPPLCTDPPVPWPHLQKNSDSDYLANGQSVASFTWIAECDD